MPSRANIPAIAALALAGTASGLYLGKAAVAEINPMYYQAPEARFHSDLSPHRPSAAAGYQAGTLSTANLEQALGRGCLGCRAYPEEVVLVHRGSSGKVEAAPAELSSAPVQAVAYEAAPSPEFAAVERYATYPITSAADEVPADSAEVTLASVETAPLNEAE